MHILYISYDGLTDPLGQSQILPYLTGLAKKGFSLSIISCEKKKAFDSRRRIIQKTVDDHGIEWYPMFYTKRPPIISTLYDLQRIKYLSKRIFKKKPYAIVHNRSYIAALAGLYLKKKFSVKFIFDMRGFWADERVDGGLWDLNSFVYAKIFRFFKNKERQFLNNADYIISLTQRGREIIHQRSDLKKHERPIEVIPCCVDTNLFSRPSEELVSRKRKSLGILPNEIVLSYLGSIGTWYMLDEMLLFYKKLLETQPKAWFLFITPDSSEQILHKCKQLNVPSRHILVHSSERKEVPLMVSVGDISIFFIRPVFSKLASSPTKLAEVLSLGIPVICNTGVGDTEKIIQSSNAGYVINEFSIYAYQKAVEHIPKLIKLNKNKISSFAKAAFSLETGVDLYEKIYRNLLK